MRTSSGTPPQNGCRLSSRRPWSKSKPSAAISRSPSAFWRSAGKRAPRAAGGGLLPAQHPLEESRAEKRSAARTGRRSSALRHARLVAVEQRVVERRGRALRPWPPPPRGPGAGPPRAPAAARAKSAAGAPRARASRPRAVARTMRRDQLGSAARWRGHVAAAHLAQVGRLPGVEPGASASARLIEQVAGLRRRSSSSWASSRSVAICSARAALPPGGIITW